MFLVWSQGKLSIEVITYNGNFKKYVKVKIFLLLFLTSDVRWQRIRK